MTRLEHAGAAFRAAAAELNRCNAAVFTAERDAREAECLFEAHPLWTYEDEGRAVIASGAPEAQRYASTMETLRRACWVARRAVTAYHRAVSALKEAALSDG